MKKILTIGIMLLFIVMTISSSTGFYLEKQSTVTVLDGNTLYVGGSGPGNYTKIQDAINDSFNGDTVFVYNGMYYENLVINKSINLIGEDRNTTVIDAKRKEDTILITSDEVCICEFTLQNSSDDGVEIDNGFGFCNILDNIIVDNSNSGIDMWRSCDNKIIGNTLFDNQGGIELFYSCDNNTIIGNNIYTYSKVTYWGIMIYGLRNNISDNIIEDCYDGILLDRSSDYNLISNNIISSCEYDGISISDSSNNMIIGNNISYNEYWGIEINGDSNDNIIYHNNLIYNYESAIDEGSNTWDDGEYGNYWSDYRQKYPFAKKLRKEGIWDTPYEIPSDEGRDNKDICPLINQWPDSFSKTVQNNENVWLTRWLERFPILQKMLDVLGRFYSFYENMKGGILN